MQLIDYDGTEAEALSDNLEDDSLSQKVSHIVKLNMLGKYETAKAMKVGNQCKCPVCGKHFTKKSYQQAFCSNKGRGNCKDAYWNNVSEERLQRTKFFASYR
jgi:hypothetical protein